MSAEAHRSPPLSSGARWVAAGVLGVVGTLGVTRGLVISPPRLLRSGPVASMIDSGVASEGAEGVAFGPPSTDGGIGPAGADSQQRPGNPGSVSRRVNINTATIAELDILPRIGPTLAARIIADREANGPFGSLDDLDRVPGIGPKTIARLVPYAAAE